ncbi:MAG TPA: hypothetical protein VIU43_08445, partial [Nitrosospira sp.]
NIERMLEQVSGINDGIDLLLKRYIGFHGFFLLNRDGGRSAYHPEIIPPSQILVCEWQGEVRETASRIAGA